MKKDNSWWYVAGITLGMAGTVAYLAYRKNTKHPQTKGDIIRKILTEQSWFITRLKTKENLDTKKGDLWSFFNNGMVLDLGAKERFSPDQKRYDNIGAWTLFGKQMEIKWQGPNDFTAYKWEVEVISPSKLKLYGIQHEIIIELEAFGAL